jgi:formylmethanofuran dehydrogenase subunit E
LDIGDKTLEERSEQVNIKTKKYQVIPLKKINEARIFVVNTARKSRIRASIICANCGAQVARQDIKNCHLCDKPVCKNCLENKNGELICTACRKVLQKVGENLDYNE